MVETAERKPYASIEATHHTNTLSTTIHQRPSEVLSSRRPACFDIQSNIETQSTTIGQFSNLHSRTPSAHPSLSTDTTSVQSRTWRNGRTREATAALHWPVWVAANWRMGCIVEAVTYTLGSLVAVASIGRYPHPEDRSPWPGDNEQ